MCSHHIRNETVTGFMLLRSRESCHYLLLKETDESDSIQHSLV